MKKLLKTFLVPIITALIIFGTAQGAIITQNYGGGSGKDSSSWTGCVQTTAGVWSTTTCGTATTTMNSLIVYGTSTLATTTMTQAIANTFYGYGGFLTGLATTTFNSILNYGNGTTSGNQVISGNLNVGGNIIGNGSLLTGITGGYFIPGTNGLYYSSTTLPNVSIGTTTAFSALSIYSSTSMPLTITVATTNSAIDTGISFRGGTSLNPSILWQQWVDDSDSDKMKFGTSSANMGLFVLGTDGYAKFQIAPNSSTSMEIKQSDTSYLTIDTSTGDGKIVVGQNLEIGTMNIDADSGGVNFVDMSITASSTAGTANNLSIALDGNAILSVYASSTGNGLIENMRVGIGTTTPLAMLSVMGIASTTGDMMRVSAVPTASTTISIGLPRNLLNPGKLCWWNGLNFTIEYYGYDALVKTVATSTICQ